MFPTKLFPALLAAISLAGSAAAQILPPVPPATPATPPYTPPPPPPAPPAPPARPEPRPADDKPLPSLIERDAAGKLKRYDNGLDEAALAKLELTADERARIETARAARRKDIDQHVIDKLEGVLAARKTGETIDQIRDLGELIKVKDTILAIAPEKSLDRLVREGAITPVVKSRVEQMARAYNNALTTERQAESGADILKIARFAAGDAFRDGTREVFASLDAMLLDAARRMEQLGDSLKFTGSSAIAFTELKGKLKPLDPANADGLKRRVELTSAFFFDRLDLAAQRQMLEKVQDQRASAPKP